jgi:hypothetical protein
MRQGIEKVIKKLTEFKDKQLKERDPSRAAAIVAINLSEAIIDELQKILDNADASMACYTCGHYDWRSCECPLKKEDE